jgi:8-oxo-dGTP pyrophosphatase MutT (NUDIX family)
MPHPLLRRHPLLAALAADLRERPGMPAETDGEPARAAVAIVLRTRPGSAHRAGERAPAADPEPAAQAPSGRDPPMPLEVLLIHRAVRKGDPWSGQVALPGGRMDPEDATLQHTAMRETREETGLDLAVDGHALGTLDELRPRTPVLPPIIVTPYVFVTSFAASFVASEEVQEAFWVPWTLFEDPLHVDQSTVQVRGEEWQVNSSAVGERVVWGMTERMVRQLAERLHRLAEDLQGPRDPG